MNLTDLDIQALPKTCLNSKSALLILLWIFTIIFACSRVIVKGWLNAICEGLEFMSRHQFEYLRKHRITMNHDLTLPFGSTRRGGPGNLNGRLGGFSALFWHDMPKREETKDEQKTAQESLT